QLEPGLGTQSRVAIRIPIAGPQFQTATGKARVAEEGLRRLRGPPGVGGAGGSCCVPLVDRLFLSFQIAGRPEPRATSGWTVVSPGYFETFNIPVVRGRTFTDRDDSGPRAVVINEALAKWFWPNSDPTNDRIIIGE